MRMVDRLIETVRAHYHISERRAAGIVSLVMEAIESDLEIDLAMATDEDEDYWGEDE
jgi:hypothetical protein